MKGKSLLVFLLLGIVSCSCSEEQNTEASDDYFELALRWPNSYCAVRSGSCRDIVPQTFTISYLRFIEVDSGEQANCRKACPSPNETLEKYKEDLLKYWPDLSTDNFRVSKALWQAQWRKYGSCTYPAMKPDDFFSFALNRRSEYELVNVLQKAGIVPTANQYPTHKILDALRRGLGSAVDIACEKDSKGNFYLSEIRQCINHSGTKRVGCNNQAKGCDDSPIFPYEGYVAEPSYLN